MHQGKDYVMICSSLISHDNKNVDLHVIGEFLLRKLRRTDTENLHVRACDTVINS